MLHGWSRHFNSVFVVSRFTISRFTSHKLDPFDRGFRVPLQAGHLHRKLDVHLAGQLGSSHVGHYQVSGQQLKIATHFVGIGVRLDRKSYSKFLNPRLFNLGCRTDFHRFAGFCALHGGHDHCQRVEIVSTAVIRLTVFFDCAD